MMTGSVVETGGTPAEPHFQSCPIARQPPSEEARLVPPAAIALANQTSLRCLPCDIHPSIDLARVPVPSMPSGVHKSDQRSSDLPVPLRTARRRAVLPAG